MILPDLFVLSTRRMEAAHRSPGTTPRLADERFRGRSGCTGEARGLPSEPVGEQRSCVSGLRYPGKKGMGGEEGAGVSAHTGMLHLPRALALGAFPALRGIGNIKGPAAIPLAEGAGDVPPALITAPLLHGEPVCALDTNSSREELRGGSSPAANPEVFADRDMSMSHVRVLLPGRSWGLRPRRVGIPRGGWDDLRFFRTTNPANPGSGRIHLSSRGGPPTRRGGRESPP